MTSVAIKSKADYYIKMKLLRTMLNKFIFSNYRQEDCNLEKKEETSK
jgi:hypothetical protein